MRQLLVILFLTSFTVFSQSKNQEVNQELLDYIASIPVNDDESKSIGTVSNGSLENGKLFPYKGNNFVYFDRESYVNGRAFVHSKVRTAVLQMYDSLYHLMPQRGFTIMECSNQEGGELAPHKTHRNGLSIDFMSPMMQNDKPYYGLDTMGALHYLLQYDDEGKYVLDKSIQIDFELLSQQIIILDHFTRKNGMKIEKVIIKLELKDELYATKYGQLIKEKGIYVVKNLSDGVNAMHDEHFHIDFGFL